MTRLLNLFLFLTLLGFLGISAQVQAQGAPSLEKRITIETKMTLGLFGILGAGTDYSIGGKKLDSYEDFKKVIYPLRDPEASRLIHEAEEAEFVWWILVVGGVAAGVDVGLTYKPVPFLNVDWIDRISTGAVALQILLAPGIILGSIASADKFNAVQRYNRLVRGEKEAGWKVSPYLIAAQGRLGLELALGF